MQASRAGIPDSVVLRFEGLSSTKEAYRGRGSCTNDNGAQGLRSRQGVDVLLDVSELEVDRINQEVKDLRAPPTEPGSAASIPGPATAGDSR